MPWHYRRVRVGINAQKLFVTQDYRNAGVSRYIKGIASHLPLVPGEEDYVLFTNQHVPAWPGVEGPRLRVRSTALPTTSPMIRILWEQTVLPVLASGYQLDVLHAPLNVQPVACTVPVVLTIHDLTFIKYPDRFQALKQRYLATLTRYSARRARRILADSAATKRDVERYFGIAPHKVQVVYPGVDPDFRPHQSGSDTERAALASFRSRQGLPEHFVLYLGTLEPRKNVDRLVAAFAEVVKRGLPHALVLAGGKGWQFESIFAAVDRYGLTERVIFPGYVSRDEQPLWYTASDLFVYPSLYEGFGLPPLEALACGVPVVTSNTSSLPEAVGSAGITVDPGDVPALTNAMISVLTNSNRADQMRVDGIAHAASFTWQRAAESCVRAYRAARGDASS
jgi:glycosyltransferase involved in cell wall biosynthesis